MFRPLIKRVATYNRRLKFSRIKERYRRQIESAGLSYDLTPDDFLAIKELVLLLFTGLGVFGYYNAWRDPTLIVVSALLGFFLPDLKLSDNAKARQRKMLKSLPNFLDLLTLSVEAGLNFVAAIRKVAERATPGPLLFRISTDAQGGGSRSDAATGARQHGAEAGFGGFHLVRLGSDAG